MARISRRSALPDVAAARRHRSACRAAAGAAVETGEVAEAFAGHRCYRRCAPNAPDAAAQVLPTDEPPAKPVPMVMVGPRLVPKPAAPCDSGASPRRAVPVRAAANARARPRPSVDRGGMAGAGEAHHGARGGCRPARSSTRAKPSTGHSFSRTAAPPAARGRPASSGSSHAAHDPGLARNDAASLPSTAVLKPCARTAVAQPVGLVGRADMGAGLQRRQQPVGDRSDGQHHGFIGAENGIVEGLRRDERRRRQLQIGAVIHQAGALPGPTPIGRIARAIGRLHHRRAAGRQHQIDARDPTSASISGMVGSSQHLDRRRPARRAAWAASASASAASTEQPLRRDAAAGRWRCASAAPAAP